MRRQTPRTVRSDGPFRSLTAALAAAVMFAAGHAAADPKPNSASANDLFEQGKLLLKAGDWLGACEKFTRSHALSPTVSTQVKIARCREHQGDLATALDDYREALELNRSLTPSSARRAELESTIIEEIKSLEPRVPRFEVKLAPRPSELQVTLDGKAIAVGVLDAPVTVSPGSHEWIFAAPGYRTQRLQKTLAEGARATLDVTMVAESESPGASASSADNLPVDSAPAPAVVPEPAVVPASPVPIDASARQRPRHTLAWILGGAGGVSLVAGGYFGIHALKLVGDARDSGDCDAAMTVCGRTGKSLVDQAHTAQTTGFVLAGMGTALVGTAVVLYVSSGDRAKGARASATTARRWVIGATPTGVRLWGSW